MDHFPEDILLLIFSQLPASNVLKLEIVCKSFYTIVQNELLWYLVSVQQGVAAKPALSSKDYRPVYLDKFEDYNQKWGVIEDHYQKLKELFSTQAALEISKEYWWRKHCLAYCCPHLDSVNIDLINSTTIAEKNKCSVCSKKSHSIWTCLNCLFVGCGRSINGHALDHYNEKNHPIAVCHDDLYIWCYSCDRYLNNKSNEEIKQVTIIKCAILEKNTGYYAVRCGWIRGKNCKFCTSPGLHPQCIIQAALNNLNDLKFSNNKLCNKKYSDIVVNSVLLLTIHYTSPMSDSLLLFELDELPSTVTKVIRKDGTEIYLVGTAHVSKQSVEDVRKCINLVKPNTIMVELCQGRISLLAQPTTTTSETENSKPKNFSQFVLQGMKDKNSSIFAIVISYIYQLVQDKLGIVPGGEFKAALEERLKLGPETHFILGDRPVAVTLKRTWHSLSIYQKIKFVVTMLYQSFFLDQLNQEMIEKMKNTDLLTEMIKDISISFPNLLVPLLEERDQYMAHVLATIPGPRIVAVVGFGHVQGISKLIDTPIDVKKLLELPPPGLSVKTTLILVLIFIGLLFFVLIKLLFLIF